MQDATLLYISNESRSNALLRGQCKCAKYNRRLLFEKARMVSAKGGEMMIRMTYSMSVFLATRYPKLYPLIGFGHLELFTDGMRKEYIEWCLTDEGKQYLKGEEKISRKDDA